MSKLKKGHKALFIMMSKTSLNQTVQDAALGCCGATFLKALTETPTVQPLGVPRSGTG